MVDRGRREWRKVSPSGSAKEPSAKKVERCSGVCMFFKQFLLTTV